MRVSEAQAPALWRTLISTLVVGVLAACVSPTPSMDLPTSSSPPSASVLPPIVIAGETPASDASVPPRAAGLPDITIEQVATVATEFSLACESFPQALEMGSPYSLDCRGGPDGVSESITVSYWAPEYIDSVIAVVVATGDGTVPAGHAGPLFQSLTSRLLGDATAAQVGGRIDDAGCTPGCSMVSDEIELILSVGLNCARQIAFGPPQ